MIEWSYITREVSRFVQFFGLEKLTGRYYSIYRGIVENIDDPKGLGRLIIRVPVIHGKNIPDDWAWPCVPIGSWIPFQKGDPIYVFFESGRVEQPIWMNGWYSSKNKLPKGADKDIIIFESRNGNQITISNNSNDIKIKSVSGLDITINDKITIGNGKYSIPLGELQRIELEKEKARLDALINSIVNSPPITPSDGGQLFKTSIELTMLAIPKGDYGNTLSNKSKTE